MEESSDAPVLVLNPGLLFMVASQERNKPAGYEQSCYHNEAHYSCDGMERRYESINSKQGRAVPNGEDAHG